MSPNTEISLFAYWGADKFLSFPIEQPAEKGWFFYENHNNQILSIYIPYQPAFFQCGAGAFFYRLGRDKQNPDDDSAVVVHVVDFFAGNTDRSYSRLSGQEAFGSHRCFFVGGHIHSLCQHT